VDVTPTTATVASGSTQQYTAIPRDANGTAIVGVGVTWTSADQTVASVNNVGLATAGVMGTTYIRARAGGVTDSAEIVVIPNNQADPPDDLFEDTNGDGIDGEIAGAVFVAPPPTGDDANVGTPDEPKATIAAAIAAAVADANKDQVYISSGTYSETVTLVAGVSLFGGYDAASDWERSFSNTAIIDGDTTAVIGASIGQPTVVDLLTIESASNTQLGGNSTGIYLTESTLVTLRNLTVTAGAGGAGIAGTDGSQGLPGKDGQGGGLPTGGIYGDTVEAPGRQPSGRGGAGGNGSTDILLAGGDGGDGLSIPGGGSGGAGGPPVSGTEDPCDIDGFNGDDGLTGSFGLEGLAGAGGNGDGSVVGGRWVGSPGADGTYGAPGFGGGGGGGGGAGRQFVPGPGCLPLAGGGGGGGGSGGQGGDFGTAGLGGGGSFGIFANNTTVDVEASSITAGNGGAGGDGGDGGPGGTGGNGAPGSGGDASQPPFFGGSGGTGGNGGAGGAGGPGGGGGGGVSYAVYTAVPAVTRVTRARAASGIGDRPPRHPHRHRHRWRRGWGGRAVVTTERAGTGRRRPGSRGSGHPRSGRYW
jgi:hypothetical protein